MIHKSNDLNSWPINKPKDLFGTRTENQLHIVFWSLISGKLNLSKLRIPTFNEKRNYFERLSKQ